MSRESSLSFQSVDQRVEGLTSQLFKDIHASYNRGAADSSMVNAFYGLVIGRTEGNVSIYSGSFSVQDFLGDYGAFWQNPRQGIIGAEVSAAKLGELVGFYHFIAGITTEGQDPIHGFSHPNPNFKMMEIADYFYQQGNRIFGRFTHENYLEEGELNHSKAFINGTKAIVLSAWQVFLERDDISSTEKKIAVNRIADYKVSIASDKRRGEFDEGLAQDPDSRPSPSAIGIK
jgi:hypothetical protein